MATSVTIKRPGVEVHQVFEEEHPTAFVPVLIPVIIGINNNVQYQIRCGGLESGSVSGATFSIPTGDDQIEGQILDATTVRVFISTTEGIFEITTNPSVEIDLDANGTLTDTITILDLLGTITKTVVSNYTSDSIVNYQDGAGNYWVRLVDNGADFLNLGVSTGDDVELSEDPTDPSSTIKNKAMDFQVVQVESSTQLKLRRTDAGWDGSSAPITNETNIKYDISRSVDDPTGDILCSYQAARLDDLHTLQYFENLPDAEEALGDAIPDNPLAFGVAMAFQGTTRQVGAMKIKADTITEYQNALLILGSYDVYCLVPLTTDQTLTGAVITHIDSMSLPENKKERVCAISRDTPSFVTKTGLAGTDLDDPEWHSATATDMGDGTSEVEFESGVDISSAKIGDIVRVNTSQNIAAVNGNTVDNSDITLQIVQVTEATRTVTILGAIGTWDGVVTPNTSSANYCAVTTPDLEGLELASYVQEQNSSLANRRVVSVFPDQVKVNATFYEMDESTYAVEQVTRTENVASYFAACVLAGQTAQFKASTPHTNTPVLGLTGLVGTTDLSETAMQVIAAGGTWIFEQANENAFVTTRHQLTTDMSSVEKREYSITKQVDFGAKIFRLYLSPLVGPNVITDKLIKNQVRPAAQAALYALKREGIWAMDSKIIDIRVDPTDPTQLLVDVDVVALYPLTYIKVTLYI